MSDGGARLSPYFHWWACKCKKHVLQTERERRWPPTWDICPFCGTKRPPPMETMCDDPKCECGCVEAREMAR